MKILRDVNFKSRPVMLAAWPGMGNVGIITIDYIRYSLKSEELATIDMAPFFIPESIIVEDGVAQLPEMPKAEFYYTEDPDIILFQCGTQIGGKGGISIIKSILDVAAHFNVREIYTAAAFARRMSCMDDSRVLGASNRRENLDALFEIGVEPMPDGYIAGQNGLVLGIASGRGIPASCLLGTIPSYASQVSFPKASLAIVKKIESVIGKEIDKEELEKNTEIITEQLKLFEERIKDYVPSEHEEDAPDYHVEDEEVPSYIMDKIERLFKEAEKDISKADKLKDELTRWNLFDLYEKRFLDLFRRK